MGKVVEYNKLVRDGMREVVEANGDRAEFHVVSQCEILPLLRKKLREEVEEFSETGDLDKLADVLAIVRAIAERDGGWAALLARESKKALARGVYDTGLFMVSAEFMGESAAAEMATGGENAD